MHEELQPGPSFAIIGRLVYSDTDQKQLLQNNTFFLQPGEAIVFLKTNDVVQEPIKFKLSDLEQVMERYSGQIQLMALVEPQTGGLLMTDFIEKIGINGTIPKELRTVVVKQGRFTFAGIWGESEGEALSQLDRLQRLRAMRN